MRTRTVGEAPLETVKRYSISNYSDPCITGLAMATLHIKMLRMTHLGNKLLVLLVQISSRSHIVSPYSQPVLLGKPGNKARMEDHSLTNAFHLSPAAPQKQVIQKILLPYPVDRSRRKTTVKPEQSLTANVKCGANRKSKLYEHNKLMNGPLGSQYSAVTRVHRST